MNNILHNSVFDYAKAIKQSLPDNVKQAIADCNASLFIGMPSAFATDCALISVALSDVVQDSLFDTDGNFLGHDGEVDESELAGEDYYKIDARQIIQYIVGVELLYYV